MKALQATETVGRFIKQSVEDQKHTGSVDIHLECSQGAICKVQVSVTERTISSMELKPEKNNLTIPEKNGILQSK